MDGDTCETCSSCSSVPFRSYDGEFVSDGGYWCDEWSALVDPEGSCGEWSSGAWGDRPKVTMAADMLGIAVNQASGALAVMCGEDPEPDRAKDLLADTIVTLNGCCGIVEQLKALRQRAGVD